MFVLYVLQGSRLVYDLLQLVFLLCHVTKASCDSAGYGFEAEYIAVFWIRLG